MLCCLTRSLSLSRARVTCDENIVASALLGILLVTRACQLKTRVMPPMKYWEIVADKLSASD